MNSDFDNSDEYFKEVLEMLEKEGVTDFLEYEELNYHDKSGDWQPIIDDTPIYRYVSSDLYDQ